MAGQQGPAPTVGPLGIPTSTTVEVFAPNPVGGATDKVRK